MSLVIEPWLYWALIGLAGFVLTAIAADYLLPLFVRRRQIMKMNRVFRGKLALTYDDGPDETLTPALLDLLDRYQAKATFFLVGFRAENNPEVCDRLVASRHEVGCHTHWHQNLWKQWPRKGVQQIDFAYHALARWIPVDAPFRPPWGKLTTWTWLALRRRGSMPVWWTHTVGDTLFPLQDVDTVCRQILDRSGGVLLLHCWHARPEQREYVLDLTQRLLEAARDNGLEVCTVSQGLAAGRSA